MLLPPYLKQGDRIGIIAPSRKVTPELLKPCIGLFESWGLTVVQGPHLYAEQNQFGGSDEQRRHDLQLMLDDADIRAVICARGGYGTIRILEGLKTDSFTKNPKWIVGYSDITVLHSYFSVMLDTPTIHAVMPINYNPEKGETPSWQKLREMLFGNLPVYELESHQFNNTGLARGKIIGGNLSVLYSTSATPYDIDTTGCILFIEDLDEYLYHIDRMMMNLKLSGKLDRLAGLIIGGMSDMRDNTVPFGKSAYEIIADYTRGISVPVVFNFPAGHTEINMPLMFGKEAELKVDKGKVLLKYL